MILILHVAVPLSGIMLASSQMMPFPGPMPMGPMQLSGQMPFPGPPPFPGPMPFMPPMPMALPQPKLPVVVMPYYSKHNKSPPRRHKKRRRPKKKYFSSESCSSESDTDSSSSSEVAFRSRKSNKRPRGKQQVLTPVVSYITKDGYVVYQKKVKRERAKNWLRSEDQARLSDDGPGMNQNGMSINDFKKHISNTFSRHGDYD